MSDLTDGELLAEEWVSELQYWVSKAVGSLSDPSAKPFGMEYNREAFENVRRALTGKVDPKDLSTFLSDFAGGLLWSLLTSFEQGPFYVRAPGFSVVVRGSVDSVASGDDFMGALMQRGLMQ